jgi:hypothetical protein
MRDLVADAEAKLKACKDRIKEVTDYANTLKNTSRTLIGEERQKSEIAVKKAEEANTRAADAMRRLVAERNKSTVEKSEANNKCEQKIKQLNQELLTFSNSLRDARREMDERKNDCDVEKKDLRLKINTLTLYLKREEQKTKEALQERDQAREESSEQMEAHNSYQLIEKKQIQDLKTEKTRLLKEAEQLSNDLESERSSNLQLTQQVRDLGQQIKDKEDQCQRKLEALRRKFETQRLNGRRNSQSEYLRDERETQIRMLQDQIRDILAEKDSLGVQLDDANEANTLMRSEVESMSRRLQKMEKERNDAKASAARAARAARVAPAPVAPAAPSAAAAPAAAPSAAAEEVNWAEFFPWWVFEAANEYTAEATPGQLQEINKECTRLALKLAEMMPDDTKIQRTDKQEFKDSYKPISASELDGQRLYLRVKRYLEEAIKRLTSAFGKRIPGNKRREGSKALVRYLLNELDKKRTGTVLVDAFDNIHGLQFQSPFSFGLQPVLSLRF